MDDKDKEKVLIQNLINPDAGKDHHYDWPLEAQQRMLGCLMADKAFLDQCFHLVKPHYFNDKAHQKICRILYEYYSKYKKMPDKLLLEMELAEQLQDSPARDYFLAELDIATDCVEAGLFQREYYLSRIAEFAKTQALRVAFAKSIDILAKNPENKWDQVEETIKEALTIKPNVDLGLNYFEDLESRYQRMLKSQEDKDFFSTGFPSVDIMLGGGLSRGEIGSFCAMCFAKGTKVLMFDGTTKNVQDIKVGDRLMGDDSTPRTVLSLANGQDQMYRVVPVKGSPFVVNGNHILSLKNSFRNQRTKRLLKNGKIYQCPNAVWHNSPYRQPKTGIFNISVNDFLKQTNSFQKHMKCWRTGVDFSYKKVKIDPYILGVWLGDGNCNSATITNIDNAVIDATYKEAETRGLVITKKGISYSVVSEEQKLKHPGRYNSKNSLINDLKYYGLLHNYLTPRLSGAKHIPVEYKTNSRSIRLKLLAGIMDTDGSRSHNGFDYVSKSEILANDVAFIARSVGLAAYVKKCKKSCQTGAIGTYWRVSISGDCSVIPVRIHRKKCSKRQQIKDVLITGIKRIEPLGIGEYYGFSVDGNHLFLLEDFTVTHNSGAGKSLLMANASAENLAKGRKVLYISLEMDEDKTACRFDSMLSYVPIQLLLQENQDVIKRLINFSNTLESKDVFYIKQFPAGAADVNTVRAYMSQLSLQRSFTPDLLIVDYVGEMKDDHNSKTYESRQKAVRDLRGLAVEHKICVLTGMQINRGGREAMKNGYIDDSFLADSQGQIRPLDALWSINQEDAESEMGVGRLFVVKHRNGKSRQMVYFKRDPNTLKTVEITSETHRKIMSEYTKKTSQNVDMNDVATKMTRTKSKMRNIETDE